MEIRSIAQFLPYWDGLRGRTRRIVAWELADGHAEVLAWFEERAAESRAIYAALSDAALLEKCRTPAGTAITTWKWLRAMTEHEAHHRGQLYPMLGMLGVATPPLFGLTSEEVRSRSPH